MRRPPPAALDPLDWTRVDNWWWTVILVVGNLDVVLDQLPNLFGNTGVGAFAQSLIDRHVDVLLAVLGLALIAAWLVRSWALRRARR
jgi:hypothetical protein